MSYLGNLLELKELYGIKNRTISEMTGISESRVSVVLNENVSKPIYEVLELLIEQREDELKRKRELLQAS